MVIVFTDRLATLFLILKIILNKLNKKLSIKFWTILKNIKILLQKTKNNYLINYYRRITGQTILRFMYVLSNINYVLRSMILMQS